MFNDYFVIENIQTRASNMAHVIIGLLVKGDIGRVPDEFK
jgi:hypothetical protein